MAAAARRPIRLPRLSRPPFPRPWTATAVDSGEIDLAWTNGDATSNIEISRATSPDGTFVPLTPTLAAGTTTYQDTGLDSGTTYYYQIRAVQGGLYSAYTNVASDTAL